MYDTIAEHSAFATQHTAKPIARPVRQKWAIALWITQVAATFAMLMAAAGISIETIVFTWPVMSIIGLALALVSRPLASWAALLFALSAPLVSSIGALVIAIFELNPDDALIPILSILNIYALSIIPLAAVALSRIRNWNTGAVGRPPETWRYSLKSLLALTTAVCVAATILSAVAKTVLGFPIAFASFAIVAAGLAFVIAWRFLAERRRQS